MKTMKKLIKMINNNSTSNNNIKNNKVVRTNKARRRLRKRINKRNAITRVQRAIRSIPMAVPSNYQKYFTMRNFGQTAVRISGCDLIYKIPNDLTTLNNTQLITMIPANPSYWTGTRIAAVAQGYQNYRPVALKIHYCPQCPVTQQGNVIGGTLWDDVPSPDSLQQSLKTSNGGFLTQCYQPTTSNIRLKSNLQMNLYRMAGKIDQQSNPFYFIAITIATLNNNNQNINPGIFYVEYTYILKNPIGTSTQYASTGLTTPQAQQTYYVNAIAVTAANLTINGAQFPPGTRLDIETNQGTVQYYYNNTLIETPTIPVWILMNQPITLAQMQRQQPPQIEDAYYISVGVITDQEQIRVPSHRAVVYNPDANVTTEWTVVYNFSSEQLYTPIDPSSVREVYQVEFNENGLPGALVIQSSTQYTLTFSMSNIVINYQPLQARQPDNTKSIQPDHHKLIDYGIIGPDSKDPDFDSSKVKTQ